jgi:hypothetical protein
MAGFVALPEKVLAVIEQAVLLVVFVVLVGGCSALMYFAVDAPYENRQREWPAECHAHGGTAVFGQWGEMTDCLIPSTEGNAP